MINIPVYRPVLAKAIVISAGVSVALVAHFAPQYSPLLQQILTVLGIGVAGTGAVQWVPQKVTVPK